jgi:hypothetical protein
MSQPVRVRWLRRKAARLGVVCLLAGSHDPVVITYAPARDPREHADWVTERLCRRCGRVGARG